MSDDVEVLDNDLVQLGTDGVNFGGVVRGTIARNRIEDFFPVNGDHPDGIQLMSPDATRQSADIRIVDNLVKAGAAAIGQVQGIFVKAENGRRYQRVEITGNLILQTGYHGICATSVDGIAVAGNEVVFQASKDGSPESWILIGDSTGRVVENRAMTLTANAPLLASGNTIRAKATEAEVQQAMSAWLARHRAPAKPEPKPEPEAEIRTITVKPGEKILIVGAA
jgi:hypothetical protein